MSMSINSGVLLATNSKAASASPTLCTAMSSSSSNIVRLAAASALSSTIRTSTGPNYSPRPVRITTTAPRVAELVTAGSDWSTMEHGSASHVTIVDSELTGVNASIEVSSEAFGYNEPIPMQYTADG